MMQIDDGGFGSGRRAGLTSSGGVEIGSVRLRGGERDDWDDGGCEGEAWALDFDRAEGLDFGEATLHEFLRGAVGEIEATAKKAQAADEDDARLAAGEGLPSNGKSVE